jgi:fructose-bisphosphate aldolase class II
MKLFLADIGVLTGPDSPFADLKVMIHLDHIQPDLDRELLLWDMRQFSSIMFDASGLPFEENMRMTTAFMREHGSEIVVEGACDEIIDATGSEVNCLTTSEKAEEYVRRTGVDLVVANLGTEHRASAAELVYRGDLARQIRERIGPRIVLHGCSSVPNEQVRHLYGDGVAKVNIWTALERDATPALFEDMVIHAAKVAGSGVAGRLANAGYLGSSADAASRPHLDYFTTVYRQGIIFDQMKRIADAYLRLWYVEER